MIERIEVQLLVVAEAEVEVKNKLRKDGFMYNIKIFSFIQLVLFGM